LSVPSQGLGARPNRTGSSLSGPKTVANEIVFGVSSGENTLQANNEGRLMDSV
jgi:hypothetical protein